MPDNNQKRLSVAETSSPSEENITTLTPSTMDIREISYGFGPVNKVSGWQIQRILRNFFPHNNITYKENVVV